MSMSCQGLRGLAKYFLSEESRVLRTSAQRQDAKGRDAAARLRHPMVLDTQRALDQELVVTGIVTGQIDIFAGEGADRID